LMEVTADRLPEVFQENLRRLGLNPSQTSKSTLSLRAKVETELFEEVSVYGRRTVMGMDSISRGGSSSQVIIEFQFRLRNGVKGRAELHEVRRGIIFKETVGYEWRGRGEAVSKLSEKGLAEAAASLMGETSYEDGVLKIRYVVPEVIVRKGILSRESHILYPEITGEMFASIERLARALTT